MTPHVAWCDCLLWTGVLPHVVYCVSLLVLVALHSFSLDLKQDLISVFVACRSTGCGCHIHPLILNIVKDVSL